jgi:hypothetical protein
MITFDELNAQGHDITELSNVLSYLLANRDMCDTEICCDLFYRYGDRVRQHLDMVDHTYAPLLSSSDPELNNTAKRFVEASHEIRRIFTQYSKQWCGKRKQALYIGNHEQFVEETNGIFNMMLNRIQDEVEHLYPLVREVRGDTQRAA